MLTYLDSRLSIAAENLQRCMSALSCMQYRDKYFRNEFNAKSYYFQGVTTQYRVTLFLSRIMK